MITLAYQPSGRLEGKKIYLHDTLNIVQNDLIIHNCQFHYPKGFKPEMMVVNAHNVTVTNCIFGTTIEEMDALYDLADEKRDVPSV